MGSRSEMSTRQTKSFGLGTVAFLLVLGACGSTTSDDATGATAAPTSATTTTTTASPSTDSSTTASPSSTTAPPAQTGNDSGLTFTVSDGWKAVSLGPGIKPVIAIDGSGSPAIAWLTEKIGDGFVAIAGASSGWETQLVKEGYFYGPIGLAYEPDGTPNVAIHDHQADTFEPNLGDLVRLYLDGDTWVEDIANDAGHDGWDTTIAIGSDGVVHAAGVDPSQFGGTDGVEYYRNDGSGWEITPIGSGPIVYQFNVGLAVDSNSNPGLTYYNDTDQDLIYASLSNGTWTLETVADEGDVGRYSSLAFDANDQPAITYYAKTGFLTGDIMFATKGDDGWTVETVGGLTEFRDQNARRNSSLAFDSQGRPNVVFSDVKGVWFAVREDSGWEVQQIVQGDLTLGQLVSLVLDADDRPHIALYEVTSSQPLDGTVAYLTTTE